MRHTQRADSSFFFLPIDRYLYYDGNADERLRWPADEDGSIGKQSCDSQAVGNYHRSVLGVILRLEVDSRLLISYERIRNVLGSASVHATDMKETRATNFEKGQGGVHTWANDLAWLLHGNNLLERCLLGVWYWYQSIIHSHTQRVQKIRSEICVYLYCHFHFPLKTLEPRQTRKKNACDMPNVIVIGIPINLASFLLPS